MNTRRHLFRAYSVLITAALAVLLLLLFRPLGAAEAQAPFQVFLSIMEQREPFFREEIGDNGYTYRVENGTLFILSSSGAELWRSDAEWWVDDFRLGDVNGDRTQDVLFSLWKSYRFGDAKPAHLENDDDTVRNHLFLYTVMPGYVKPVWCSSDLPRPIYRFEIDPSGEVTPLSSGMLLRTEEGEYRDDFSRTQPVLHKYAWEGWGFVPKEPAIFRATISVTGDLMVHQQQMDDALQKGRGEFDFDHCFERIRSYLHAYDYTIGNLETTFPGDPVLYSDYPRFGAPDSFGLALKNAGFNMVTTANNHCFDKGEDGLVRTLDVLDSLGIDHLGTYRTKEERDAVFLKSINGITFAFVSYTYGINGLELPEGKDYLVNTLNEQDSNAMLLADIAAAKELDPDIVIVLPHMGDEYSLAPQQRVVQSVHDMFTAGADIVLATHPHVLQPAAFVDVEDEDGCQRRCFAAYSLGNFISSQRDHGRDAGIIMNLAFEKVEGEKAVIRTVTYVPTWVQFAGLLGGFDIKVLPVYDVLTAHADSGDFGLRTEDVERLHGVLAETAEMFFGEKIDIAIMRRGNMHPE